MINSFRSLRTQVQNFELEASRISNKAARRLLNEEEPPDPYLEGHTTRAIIKFRIEQVRRCYNPLYYSNQPPRFLMLHHAEEALNDLDSYIQNWGWEPNNQKSGHYLRKAGRILIGLNERIFPAIEVAEAEFDPFKVLRQTYVTMQTKSLSKIDLTRNKVKCNSKKHRDSVRQTEISESKSILQDFRDELSTWVATLKHGNELY